MKRYLLFILQSLFFIATFASCTSLPRSGGNTHVSYFTGEWNRSIDFESVKQELTRGDAANDHFAVTAVYMSKPYIQGNTFTQGKQKKLSESKINKKQKTKLAEFYEDQTCFEIRIEATSIDLAKSKNVAIKLRQEGKNDDLEPIDKNKTPKYSEDQIRNKWTQREWYNFFRACSDEQVNFESPFYLKVASKLQPEGKKATMMWTPFEHRRNNGQTKGKGSDPKSQIHQGHGLTAEIDDFLDDVEQFFFGE